MKKSSYDKCGQVGPFIFKYYPEYWGISEYPANKCVPFCKVRDEWGIFSNFAPTPIPFEGRNYSCVEQLFQCMKFTDPEVIGDIMSASGQRIKMKAKHWVKEGKIRPDWGQRIVDALRQCLRLKFAHSEEFRKALRESGDRFIVEDESCHPRKYADAYGCKLIGDKYIGPNLMGRLLMELRRDKILDSDIK
ncbi:MAG: NADAR family protein [Bacteroides sp.]|nr:NADAR family protein [Bacteroides sp.]MDE5827400.1 NADAR family protein [Duncaniella sp.]